MNGPVLVREHELTQPGLHTHNTRRRAAEPRKSRRKLFLARMILLLMGLGGVGYYGYELADRQIYQAYENWAFNQQIGGHAAVTLSDYVRERFGFLVAERPAPSAPVQSDSVQSSSVQSARPAPGSILGRVEIGRLNLTAMVREGVDPDTLNRAVGHVPTTALAGQDGNFAIAAHRDTLFRALKDIHNGDLVTFQSETGAYKYQVFSTRIVKPSDIGILRPDGGLVSQRKESLLTMITCYPFYYVGSAPKRFIVQAKLLPGG